MIDFGKEDTFLAQSSFCVEILVCKAYLSNEWSITMTQ